MTKPPPNVLDLPLLDRAEMAMKAAIEKVIEEHIREGLPLYVWQDEKVVAIPPEELKAKHVNPRFNEQLLFDFASRFLGYGSLQSRIWLIGPEVGGGESVDEVYTRASVWWERGQKETEDLHSYHAGLNIDWTQEIQPTWGKLIRVILALNGRGEATTEDVRQFQLCKLGRADGQNCVLDLSPLSSPSTSDWKLAEFGFDWLRTRQVYEARLLPARCALLREKVTYYKPRLVLFYGLQQRQRWKQISACPFSSSKLERLLLARSDDTLFALIPHPANLSRTLPGTGAGKVKKFLAAVGATLCEELRSVAPSSSN